MRSAAAQQKFNFFHSYKVIDSVSFGNLHVCTYVEIPQNLSSHLDDQASCCNVVQNFTILLVSGVSRLLLCFSA